MVGWLVDLILSVPVNNFQSYWNRANTSYVFLVLLESKWVLLKDSTLFFLILLWNIGCRHWLEPIYWNKPKPICPPLFQSWAIKKKKLSWLGIEPRTLRLQILQPYQAMKKKKIGGGGGGEWRGPQPKWTHKTIVIIKKKKIIEGGIRVGGRGEWMGPET